MVERVLDILTLLADHPQGLPISEVSRRLDLPKSAVHRLLSVLVSRGLAVQDEYSQRYRMTVKLAAIGFRFLAASGITDMCQPSLDRLAARTGELVRLALVEDDALIWIAKAQGAFRLAFGSGDFRRDTGMAATAEAMAYPRAKLVVASRVGNLPGPIDGPTVGTNHPILREQTGITVMMGMTGKLCLAIDQTPVINEVISPTPSDVAWATDFMADFEASGRVIRDGSDLPRLGRAEKIMKLAVAFGVQPAL